MHHCIKKNKKAAHTFSTLLQFRESITTVFTPFYTEQCTTTLLF